MQNNELAKEEILKIYKEKRREIEKKYPIENFSDNALDYRDGLMRAEILKINKWLKEEIAKK